jgi:hypothetical protein
MKQKSFASSGFELVTKRTRKCQFGFTKVRDKAQEIGENAFQVSLC